MKEQPQTTEPTFDAEAMKMPEGVVSRNERAGAPSQNIGVLIALLFVVLAIIAGGMYYWFMLSQTPVVEETSLRPSAAENQEPESTNARADVDAMSTLSTSNELPAIYADIQSTDVASLNSELVAIEAEITAAANAGQ